VLRHAGVRASQSKGIAAHSPPSPRARNSDHALRHPGAHREKDRRVNDDRPRHVAREHRRDQRRVGDLVSAAHYKPCSATTSTSTARRLSAAGVHGVGAIASCRSPRTGAREFVQLVESVDEATGRESVQRRLARLRLRVQRHVSESHASKRHCAISVSSRHATTHSESDDTLDADAAKSWPRSSIAC